jgi:uroporphyrinogen decarboxylase
MNQRENVLSLFRREGYSFAPCQFRLTPHLIKVFYDKTGYEGSYEDYFNMPWRNILDLDLPDNSGEYSLWYDNNLKPGTIIDVWGIAHEPGSEAAMHMTRMRHPLEGVTEIDRIKAYPFPEFEKALTPEKIAMQKDAVEEIRRHGLAAMGNMQNTIWERAWYIRGMNDLMMDMMDESETAEYILDKVTEQAVVRARAFAEAGADILFLGDDIGMQRSVMMSEDLYRTWLKPRLKKVIDAGRAVNKNIIVMYHSCGYIIPFIKDLIEAGIDVLNPIQPESMDYREIAARYGSMLSFYGCIGTQTVMPFGTTAEVKASVKACLETAGEKGGILAAPTHILEPEVPWENIIAYVEACNEYTV